MALTYPTPVLVSQPWETRKYRFTVSELPDVILDFGGNLPEEVWAAGTFTPKWSDSRLNGNVFELQSAWKPWNWTGEGIGFWNVPRIEAGLPEGPLNVRWFGAKGDNDQSLHPTDYLTNLPVTQNTADAIAINKAINYVKSLGGGHLYFPKGVYRVYAFLEMLTENVHISGDGPGITVFKNNDNSPVTDSRYGIFLVAPNSLKDVSFSGFTLDGSVYERGNPEAEYFSYPLVWLGKVRGRVHNVVSIHSPIDCMCTTYENADESSLRVSDCIFDTAYRNSVSVVSGANQQYINCQFLRGGIPYGGHNPRYCIDIEPDDIATTLKNLSFTNCVFKEANGVAVAGGIWAQARFVNCRFDSSDGAPDVANPPGYPYVGIWNGGQFSFVGCSFYGADNRSAFSSGVELTGPFGKTSFVELKDCYMEGAAPELYCPQIRIDGLAVVNSGRPMLLAHGDGTFEQQVHVCRVQLTNVVDTANVAGGAYASLALSDTCTGYWSLSDIDCTWNGDLVPASVLSDLDAPAACGVYLSPVATATMRLSNITSAGWYRKYPESHGKSPGGSFLDWSPSSPVPADTTGTSLVVGGKFYRGCTEYGNNP